MIRYIRSNAQVLSIDENRLAIWASSGNTVFGLPLALKKNSDYIRCAVFYYGMGDDFNDLKPFRQDIPLFIVRSGLDSFRANRNIDRFIHEALNADIDFELINYLSGHHGFDIADNNKQSREIIKKTLYFLKTHLQNKSLRKKDFLLTSKNLYSMIVEENNFCKAKKLLMDKVKLMKTDKSKNPFLYAEIADRSLCLIAQELEKEGMRNAAIDVYKSVIEIYPDYFPAYLSLIETFERDNQISLALKYAKRSLKLMNKIQKLDKNQLKMKKNILAVIKRLEKKQ